VAERDRKRLGLTGIFEDLWFVHDLIEFCGCLWEIGGLIVGLLAMAAHFLRHLH